MSEEFEKILDDCIEEAAARLEEAGESAVGYNKEFGDYRDRTGNLRRSNFYEVTRSGNALTLSIGNSAEYAEAVESRGRMVITGGVLLAHKMFD